MTTSSARDAAVVDRLAHLPRLRRDEGGPVFAEPWQAEAFALAVQLSNRGYFTWKEWAATLADELDRADRRGEPDDGSRYYEHWLAALERLVAAKGLADTGAMAARKQAWADAYRNTPHGFPVALAPSRRPGSTWLLLGAVSTLAAYWVLSHGGVGAPADAVSLSDAAAHETTSSLPLGFAASAGLGVLLGMRHALEPDHLAAVTTLMTGERGSTKAAWLGASWGLGHTLTLLLAGALLVALQTEMPAIAAHAIELGVALLLVGFGVRAIHQSATGASVRPTHVHGRQATRFPVDRWTLARPLLVGAVHGLAGSGAMTALVVTTLPTLATRLGYLVLFGVGSTVGMAALSGLLGWPIARLGTDHLVIRVVSLAVGSVSAALGLVWIHPLLAGLF